MPTKSGEVQFFILTNHSTGDGVITQSFFRNLILDSSVGRSAREGGRLGEATLVRLRVRTNSGVEVPIGQNTGCP
jgi:hypothetical protein